ncbi:hypothetical protein QTP88_014816 [Uroleucon formosanum]
MDYFKFFFIDEIIDLMVIETNRNAQRFLNTEKITRGSRFSFWQPINQNDMEKYMGLLMWMGLIKITSIADYWSRAERYINGVAPKTMSRNKFELILRFWHFEAMRLLTKPIVYTNTLEKKSEWKDSTATDANILLKSVDSEFLVSLQVVKTLFAYGLPLCNILQKIDINLKKQLI